MKKNFKEMATYEKKYKKYFDIFEKKSLKTKAGLPIKEDDIYALGKQLEKFEEWVAFKESNASADDLGILPKVGLDVIAASNATSVIPLIAGVQPIEERKGLVWFKNIVAMNSRGNIQANQTLLDARKGRIGLADSYATETITDEVVATGDGKATEFNVIVKYAPMRLRYTKITVDGQPETVLVDDGEGHLIGTGGKGTISYEDGKLSITFDNAPADGANIKVSYATNLEELAELQTINTEYDSVEVTARTYALRTEIGLFKSYEMSRRFNVDVEEMLARDLVTELTTQLSTSTVRALYVKTPDSGITWDKNAPQGVSFMEHLLSFSAVLADAENRILAQAGRLGEQVVYIVGHKASSIFKMLPGFKPATDVKATLGTHLFGYYEGKPIVRSLAIPDDEVIIETRGSDNYDSPVIYAPYMPLFVTDTFHGMDHNPLNSQKAAAAMVGIKATIPTLATKFKIVNA